MAFPFSTSNIAYLQSDFKSFFYLAGYESRLAVSVLFMGNIFFRNYPDSALCGLSLEEVKLMQVDKQVCL